MAASPSGHRLKAADAPIILGMVNRGDRDHDIAAWFGVNQGRIPDVKDGTRFGTQTMAPAHELPPKGPPGVKGRRLRAALDNVIALLAQGEKGADKASVALKKAMDKYDANDP